MKVDQRSVSQDFVDRFNIHLSTEQTRKIEKCLTGKTQVPYQGMGNLGFGILHTDYDQDLEKNGESIQGRSYLRK